MSEKNSAPELRFNDYFDDWDQNKLSDLFDFQNGFNGSSDRYGQGTKLISVMDILNNQYITYENIRGMANVNDDEKRRYSVEYGDILFQRSSENFEDAGRTNVYLGEKLAVFGGFVIRGKKKTEYDPFWVKYALDSSPVRKQITTKAQGAQHINVSQDTLSDVDIMMPKLDEQKIIGNYFHNIDDLIDIQQQKLEKLYNMKKSCLQKMFPKHNEEMPEIRFEGFLTAWKNKPLGECFDERMESMPEGELLSVTIGSGIKKFLELDRHDNSNSDKSKYKKVCVGDIAYNSMRMWQGASGFSPYEGIVSPAYTVVKPKDGIDSQFFAYMFKKKEMIHLFEINSQGLTSDTWNLKYPAFSKIVVRVPDDIKEQRKIAGFLQNLDEMIMYAEQELELTKRMKKGCLQKMFV